MPPPCFPKSSSSAGPTSASRRCSTGWSARSSRWSTTSPASRATAASARRTCSGSISPLVDTAGWEDEDAETLPGRMRAQTEVCARRRRRRAVRDRRARRADPARRGNRPLAARVDGAGGAGRQQGRGQRRATAGFYEALFARASASRCRSRPSTARAWPTCSRRCCRISTTSSPSEEADAEDEEDEDGRRPAQARHRRAAQRRQVDADQPHARRGPAADRARGRDHPRFDRGRLGVDRPQDRRGAARSG